MTSIIAPSVLSGSQVGGFFNGSIANLQALAGRHSLPTPDVRARRSPFAQILSNPIAGLAHRFGPSSKQLQHSMDQPGEVIWPILSDRSGAAKDPGPHRFVQFGGTGAPERMHKFLDTTHRKPLLPLHLQV